jgi:hypothetical protein
MASSSLCLCRKSDIFGGIGTEPTIPTSEAIQVTDSAPAPAEAPQIVQEISSPEPAPIPVQSETATEQIRLEYPENNSVVSGEKKIKISISELTTDQYTATYSVDGRPEQPMDYGSHETYQQIKIDFEKEWTWNGAGPYVVVITVRDTAGNLIDTEMLTLYVKH